MSDIPKVRKQVDWERIATFAGIFLGYFSWGVIKGIQTFPRGLEVAVFVPLYILVGEALVFSIIFYFQELIFHRTQWKIINSFFNGLVVTFAGFDVLFALLTYANLL